MTHFVSLMYHNVCPERAADGSWPGFRDLSPSVTGYFVDRAMFERHGAMIAATGRALPVTISSQTDDPSAVARSRRPGIQITFDDGWRGTIDEAGPILESCGLSAMLFVTSDLIGHPLFVDRHQLTGSAPTFDIGAHGRTHRLLAQLSDADVREELTTSKSTLEDILGRAVDSIAFPGGSYDSRVVEMAEDVGFRRLFTSDVGLNDGLADGSRIRRVPIKSDLKEACFKRYLQGDLRRERLRGLLLATAKQLVGRRGYAALRSRLLSEESTHLEMTDLVHTTVDMATPANP